MRDAPARVAHAGFQRSCYLDGQERVTAARRSHPGTHRWSPSRTQALAEKLAYRRLFQGAQQELMPGLGQPSGQVGAGSGNRSCRYQDAQTTWFDGNAAQREAEGTDARPVQPLQVVNEKRDRPRLAKLREQSSDCQGYRQGIDLALAGFGSLQRHCQGAALRTWKAAVSSLGKLANQFGKTREWQFLIELCRSDRKHPVAPGLGLLGCGPHQAALANTGITFCHCASAADQDVVHYPQSVLAAVQPEDGRSLLHVIILPDRNTHIEGSARPLPRVSPDASNPPRAGCCFHATERRRPADRAAEDRIT